MSNPLLPYNPNNGAMVQQRFNGPDFDVNQIGNQLLGSIFSLANQLMTEILSNGPGIDGIASFMNMDPNNPQMKIIGISSMNVAQIAHGPDGRPHIIQALDERQIGPGGIRQTKRALRDPDRGIDRVQIGYFAGDREEIIDRRFDPSTRQYQEEVQERVFAPNQPKYPQQLPIQSQQQRQPALPAPQQYQYYPRQQPQQYSPYPQQYSPYPQQSQQFSFYPQQPPQAFPRNPIYPYL